MAATPDATQVKKRVNSLVIRFAKLIREQGGVAYLVGGSVRDILLGKKITDYDIEVHGLEALKIKKAVRKFGGRIFEVGKVFGVLKIVKGKTEIDVTLPRRDSKISSGHKGFAVNTDPFMGMTEAARRRDFTINAIALDLLTGKIHDPFNGVADLKNKSLKAVDPKTFPEDPLRVLRGMQLAARFNLELNVKSKNVLAKALPEMKYLSQDRIWAEWRKLLLAEKPSSGLELGRQIGLYKKYYPELEVLKKTFQNTEWHPEKDVWSHTKYAADLAAHLCREEKLNEEESLVLTLAAICHDLGKATTTKMIGGRLRSFGHAEAGVKPTRKFLKTIGAPRHLYKPVEGLVLTHMRPLTMFFNKHKISTKGLRRLARDLSKYNLNLYMLNLLNTADMFAIGPHVGRAKARELKEFRAYSRKLVAKANKALVLKRKPADVIRGRDLLKAGFSPGPQFGKLISMANRLHEEKGYNKNKILKYLKEYYA